ncbi:MAG: hypothetical protein JO108_19105 [Acidobacteriaceae bacterium]|nr:hypothetical protein [Acidobacteriaceae bacterium]
MRTAAPAICLAAVLLLPFLHNAYTIDDPLFLREAEHTLHDPLHPTAFPVVWNRDIVLRASAFLPGGPVVPFLLLPVVIGGEAEWIGHGLQILYLAVTACGTVLLAMRCNLTEKQASMCALITVSTPAVLGMAGTIMPDIASLMFTVLALERLLGFRDERLLSSGLLATVWMVAAALTRSHLLLLVGPALLLLIDRSSVRWSWQAGRRLALSIWPVLVAPLLFVLFLRLTSDPLRDDLNIVHALRTQTDSFYVRRNAIAFLVHWAFALPMAIPYLLIRGRNLPWRAFGVFLPFAAVELIRDLLGRSTLPFWIWGAGLLSALMLFDMVLQACRTRDRTRLSLCACLFLGLAALAYVHLPCKYLIPSVPAAAILLVLAAPSVGPRYFAVVVALIAVGAAEGVLLLQGEKTLAASMYNAVNTLVKPHIQAGQTVWYAGHWGFHWYAEHAGARPLTLNAPFPHRGDIIVVSRADEPHALEAVSRRKLLQVLVEAKPSIRIMDPNSRAGFFSNYWGAPLPLGWGSTPTNRFELWRVE